MKQLVTFELDSRHVNFNFTLKRKYTFIQGDSGTGKTRLATLLNNYLNDDKCNGIKINCTIPVAYHTNEKNFYTYHKKEDICLHVLDENACRTIAKNSLKRFAEETLDSKGIFLLMTRSSFTTIPYSVYEIYDIKQDIKGNKSYKRLVTHYSWEFNKLVKPDCIITEDSKIGYKFFEETSGCRVVSSNGNSNIDNELLRELRNDSKTIFIYADGAAYGSFISKYMKVRNSISQHIDIRLFCPESFEYIILKANLFGGIDVTDELENTWKYADTSKFASWERYYTYLLGEITKRFGGYNKASSVLPKYLIADKSVKKMYRVMEEIENVKTLVGD